MKKELVKTFCQNLAGSDELSEIKMSAIDRAIRVCEKPHDRMRQKALSIVMDMYGLGKYWPGNGLVIDTTTVVPEQPKIIETTMPAWSLLQEHKIACFHFAPIIAIRSIDYDADGVMINRTVLHRCNYVVIGDHRNSITCTPINSIKLCEGIKQGLFTDHNGALPTVYINHINELHKVKHVAVRVDSNLLSTWIVTEHTQWKI